MDAHTPEPPRGATEPSSVSEALLNALYMGCIGGAGQGMSPAMALALQASFGSVERWQDEFVALGKELGPVPTGLLLAWQPREGRLVNRVWPDPASQAASGLTLLALDMHAHKLRLANNASGVDSIDAFVRDIHWANVHSRYQQAVEATSEQLGASPDELQGARLVDVRRAAVYAQADSVLPGATWCDPVAVGDWGASLPRDESVVVYCVHGHEVSRATALRLRALGLEARFLRGGIEGWKQAGLAVRPRNDA